MHVNGDRDASGGCQQRVACWVPGFARSKWGSLEGVDTQARSTVENKCLFEQENCCAIVSFFLKTFKT